MNPRFGPVFVHQNPNNQISPQARIPVRPQQVVVSPRHQGQMSMASGHPAVIPQHANNEYYQTNNDFIEFDSQGMLKKQRERVITTQPNMHNNIEFATNEQQVPWCCMGRDLK